MLLPYYIYLFLDRGRVSSFIAHFVRLALAARRQPKYEQSCCCEALQLLIHLLNTEISMGKGIEMLNAAMVPPRD